MVSWLWPSCAETLVISSRRLPAGTVGNVNWHWLPGHVAESATKAVAWYGSPDWASGRALGVREVQRAVAPTVKRLRRS
jgi:hypothetical protein